MTVIVSIVIGCPQCIVVGLSGSAPKLSLETDRGVCKYLLASLPYWSLDLSLCSFFCLLQRTFVSVWKYFWLLPLGNAAGIWWVKAKDAATHAARLRTAPLPPPAATRRTRAGSCESLAASGADVEKLWFTGPCYRLSDSCSTCRSLRSAFPRRERSIRNCVT